MEGQSFKTLLAEVDLKQGLKLDRPEFKFWCHTWEMSKKIHFYKAPKEILILLTHRLQAEKQYADPYSIP